MTLFNEISFFYKTKESFTKKIMLNLILLSFAFMQATLQAAPACSQQFELADPTICKQSALIKPISFYSNRMLYRSYFHAGYLSMELGLFDRDLNPFNEVVGVLASQSFYKFNSIELKPIYRNNNAAEIILRQNNDYLSKCIEFEDYALAEQFYFLLKSNNGQFALAKADGDHRVFIIANSTNNAYELFAFLEGLAANASYTDWLQ